MSLATAVRESQVDVAEASQLASGYKVGQSLGAKDRQLLRVLTAAGACPVVDIKALIAAGKTSKDKKYPALAFAGADDRTVKVRCGNEFLTFTSASAELRVKREGTGVKAPKGTDWSWRKEIATAVAEVPIVPPEIRPADEPISELFVAFEADWKDKKSEFVGRPVDPILLKHVEGDLYAVLGTWDMTTRELAAMKLARRDG